MLCGQNITVRGFFHPAELDWSTVTDVVVAEAATSSDIGITVAFCHSVIAHGLGSYDRPERLRTVILAGRPLGRPGPPCNSRRPVRRGPPDQGANHGLLARTASPAGMQPTGGSLDTGICLG